MAAPKASRSAWTSAVSGRPVWMRSRAATWEAVQHQEVQQRPGAAPRAEAHRQRLGGPGLRVGPARKKRAGGDGVGAAAPAAARKPGRVGAQQLGGRLTQA